MAEDIPEIALAWHRAGRRVAFATVIGTWGSAPRPVGAMMVVDGEGAMEGSVSGGCVEGAVVLEALEALREGRARRLDYGVADADAFAVGLACGGRISILVQPLGTALPLAALEALVAARADRRPIALVSDLTGDAPARIEAATAEDRPGLTEGGEVFRAVQVPPLRLAIVGAVHVAQALVPMARTCGYACTVIDPRPAFLTSARFPDVPLLDAWPDAALRALAPDARTAVVTLSHDPKIDDPALRVALDSPAFYIGCLGSRRTQAARLERLQEAGVDPAALSRLHGPVGLPIGAVGAGEIAVSILAEVISAARSRD